MSEKNISKHVLRSFIPWQFLSDEQLDLLLEKSQVLNLFNEQILCDVGDNEQVHFYLLNGQLDFEHVSGKKSSMVYGEEMAYQPIAHHFPRRFKVSAHDDARVLKVPSDLLEKLLCWRQVSRCMLSDIAMDENYQEDFPWIKKLLESKLFYKVPPTNIYHILDHFEEQAVTKGDQVIVQGEVGTCCYFIKQGQANVFVLGEGDEPVATISEGNVFGEDALVNDKPRNASIVMASDGVLMRLEKARFFELLKAPSITMVTPSNIEGFLESGAVLLDVRTQDEFDLGHHPKALNIPLHIVLLKSALLDKSQQYITYSGSEDRSKAAAHLLNEAGYNVFAMQGSVDSLNQLQFDSFRTGKA